MAEPPCCVGCLAAIPKTALSPALLPQRTMNRAEWQAAFFGAGGSFTEILHTARKVPQFATLRALIFGTNFRQRIAIFLALCEKIAYNGADIN